MAEIAALSEKDVGKQIKLLEKQMLEYARDLQFEKAAQVRDQLARLNQIVVGARRIRTLRSQNAVLSLF